MSVDVENKSFVYKKGEKLGAMMNQLQQVKKAFPELCEKTLILQQPAAFRDGIIVAWCMQDLHLRRPYLLMQHDLVGCQATAEVKKLRFMLMQPDAQICGEMTACSQLTDIMIARAVKGIARKQIPEIRRWLKEKARRSGEAANYKAGVLEILMISEAIDRDLQRWLDEYDFIFFWSKARWTPCMLARPRQ